MKVVALFGTEKPRKEELKKFSVLVDELAGKLPGDADVEWYLLSEDDVKNIEKEVKQKELNKDTNTFSRSDD